MILSKPVLQLRFHVGALHHTKHDTKHQCVVTQQAELLITNSSNLRPLLSFVLENSGKESSSHPLQ